MPSDVPDWAKGDAEAGGGGGAGAGAPAAPAPAGGGGEKEGRIARANKAMGNIKKTEITKLLKIMRFINVLNGIGMILTSVLLIMSGLVSIDFSTITLAIYIICFGLLLVLIELNFSNLEPTMRRLFGFMYTYTGRLLYLLFAASINFSVDLWPGYLVGSLTIANGLFNVFVICRHPAFQAGGSMSASDDPYAHYTGGEAEVADYVRRNPELARKAMKKGVAVARDNPAATQRIAAQAVAAERGGAGGGDDDNPFASSAPPTTRAV